MCKKGAIWGVVVLPCLPPDQGRTHCGNNQLHQSTKTKPSGHANPGDDNTTAFSCILVSLVNYELQMLKVERAGAWLVRWGQTKGRKV